MTAIKICPVMGKDKNGYFAHCQMERCAWYNEWKDRCCIVAMSEGILETTEGQKMIFTREI